MASWMLLDSKPVRGAGCADHIFFDHNASKIICSGMQAKLRGLFTYREPADAWIFFTFGSMIRLMAIIRIYSSGVVRL